VCNPSQLALSGTCTIIKVRNGGISDQELENAGTRGEPGVLEESDNKEVSWDGLLIEDDDDMST